MNTLLSLLALSCLCGLSAAFFGKDFVTGDTGSPVTKRDCQWMAWGPVGRCTPKGTGWFVALQTRHQVSARNGGNDCVGSNRRYVPCTELEYVASTFLDAVTTQSRGNQATDCSGHTICSVPDEEISCARNFTDAAGNVRMLGKYCNSRFRRSADGNIEVDEGQLMERIRKKRQIRRRRTAMKHRDMLFLLDESGSVDTTNFKKVVRLAKAIIGDLCGSIRIGKDKTRIGVMGFDSIQHPMLNFKELFDQPQILTHMDTKVTYTSSTDGSTCLNNALEYARTKMFHKDRGARLNSGVEQTIVLITDGCANCIYQGDTPTSLDNMRRTLENDGISIIVYFIGNLARCEKTLNDLLSPGSGRCFDLMTAPTWAYLDGVSAYIEDPKNLRRCTDSWKGAPSCA